jgi:hypothetical protein
MPFVDDSPPPDAQFFGAPQVDVSALYEDQTAYRVISLAQSERIRPRDSLVIPCITVSFAVPPFAGVFTINIDNYAFTHADVTQYMEQRAYLIRGLYALPGQLPAYVPPQTAQQTVIADLEAAAEAAALASIGGFVP